MGNFIKSGTTILTSVVRRNVHIGIEGLAEYGPTDNTGFYNGITPPVGGYTIYVLKESQGPSIHVANNDSQCIFFLKSFGATGTTISDVLAWSNEQANLWVTSSDLTSADLVTYTAGLYKRTYSGYHNENPSFFATATPTTFGSNPATSVQTTSISEPASDDGSNFSVQWLGYFKPTTTQNYTFFISSDDGSYLWIGPNALSGFTTANANVNNGGAHGNQEVSGTVSLTADTYYPIRMQFGEINGGDVFSFNYSTPTITKTTNVTGLVFYNSLTNGF
jgi:hypothetical protein